MAVCVKYNSCRGCVFLSMMLLIPAVQLCQMIHPLLLMMRGNLEHVNTICGECVKVHSPKRGVQTSVGFAIVMAWRGLKHCVLSRSEI